MGGVVRWIRSSRSHRTMPYRYENTNQGYFHVYNRGNNKLEIFEDDEDYGYFITRMNQYRMKYKVLINCYCLMPNHFHLSLCINERADSSNFMKQVQMVYAQYLQKKYNWIGHVFQGRYKTRRIRSEQQFIYLSAYIHSNPKVAGLVNDLNDWPWSSYLDFVGLRNGKIPQKEVLLNYFESREEYGCWVNRISDEKIKEKLEGLVVD